MVVVTSRVPPPRRGQVTPSDTDRRTILDRTPTSTGVGPVDPVLERYRETLQDRSSPPGPVPAPNPGRSERVRGNRGTTNRGRNLPPVV